MAERFRLDANGLNIIDTGPGGLDGETYFLDGAEGPKKLVALLNCLEGRVCALSAESRARMLAGRALWEAGELTVRHDEDCLEDDTCECPEATLASAVLDDDADLDEVQAAIEEIDRRNGDFPKEYEET